MEVTNRLADYKCGARLPNGAIVVTVKSTGLAGVVLANLPTNGYTPWVTWTLDISHADTTTAGHYHTTLTEAVADFEAR